MKRMFLLFGLAATVVACGKEIVMEISPVTSKDPHLVQMTFEAVTEGSTKTSIDMETNIGAVSWEEGDAVKFMWELTPTDNAVEPYNSSAHGSARSTETDINDGVARFTVNDMNADFGLSTSNYKSRHMYAVYPADTEMYYYSNYTDYNASEHGNIDLPNTGGHLYVGIPAQQTGKFEDASIALAKWSSPSERLEFKTLCGLLQVKVANENVKYIRLTCDKPIAGLLDVSFVQKDHVGDPVERLSDGLVYGVNEITVTIDEPTSTETPYYIAVRPGSLENMYVGLYNESDELIGDKFSKLESIPVKRQQIRKLGTLTTVVATSDGYYVKADGTGSGSSWDDAAGVTGLTSLMNSTDAVVTKNVYLAAGDYIVGQGCAPKPGSTLKLYGGYPNNLRGRSLSGRDVENNISRFYGNNSTNKTGNGRNFWTQKGNWVFDGLTFTSTGYWTDNSAPGCALLLLNGTESVTVNNCKFINSRHAGYDATTQVNNGGAVRVATTATFTNCTFKDNTSVKGNCGAVFVTNTGSFTARNCVFENNQTSLAERNGGAIYNNGGTVTLENCTVKSNTTQGNGGAVWVLSTGTFIATNCLFSGNTTTGDSKVGGAIYNQGTAKITDCYFLNNAATGTNATGGTIASEGASAVLYLDRCCFRNEANTQGLAKKSGHYIEIKSGTLGVNNCTFAGPWGISPGYQINNAGTAYIVNSTFHGQIGPSKTDTVSNHDGGLLGNSGNCTIVNSIFINAASSGDGVSFINTGTLSVGYSIYNKQDTDATNSNNLTVSPQETCISSIRGNTTGSFTNWYDSSAATMKTDDQAETIDVNDVREKVYYYPWPSPKPAALNDVSYPSLTNVKNALGDSASAFITWLTDDNLSKDIRGVERTTTAMWPGSYQGTGTP